METDGCVKPFCCYRAEETALQTNQKPPQAKDVTWSASQRPKSHAMTGPRFEQTNMAAQPNPLPAIELIKKVPIRFVHSRVAVCDGGGGALGHPKIFINLDPPGPQPCGQSTYLVCTLLISSLQPFLFFSSGLRFERSADPHH
ncbi:hypothetical protein VP01_2170g3 [Puccinia sorghi]|uniref:Zinc finger CHCC-type domain-containing protein n=1 Tax=Puccinia sorghi TaxID=27349 RepID=A0A0L6VA28_9BASI|nr:hypothetical protein VP01_2170g3 [Puccinia sorghi]